MADMTKEQRDALVSQAVEAARTDAKAKQVRGTVERQFYVLALNIADAVEMDGTKALAEFDAVMAAGRERIVDDLDDEMAAEFFHDMTRETRLALAANGELPPDADEASSALESFYTYTSRTKRVLKAYLAPKDAIGADEFAAYLVEWRADVKRPSGTLWTLAGAVGKAPKATPETTSAAAQTSGESTTSASGGETEDEPDSLTKILADVTALHARALRLSDVEFARFADAVVGMLQAKTAPQEEREAA